MNNSNQNSNFVEALTEIFHELLKVILLLLKQLGKHLWRRFRELHGVYENLPIDPKLVRRNKRINSFGTIGYSLSRRMILKCADWYSATHTAIVGTTGSGKSVLMRTLFDATLRKGGAVIYFDPKPTKESIQEFRAQCEAYGKKHYVFSDFDENPDLMNPLIFGDHNDTLSQIMDALEWSEVFYKNECQEALSEALLQIRNDNCYPTVSRIVEKLKKHPNKKSLSAIITQLNLLNNSNFGPLINTDGDRASLIFVGLEESCIYIGISSMNIGSSGNILNKLFFGNILYVTNMILKGELWQHRRPMTIFFDELSSTVHSGFIDLLNKCRAARIEIVYATQCPSDLDRINEHFKKQVFENTNNFFVSNLVVQEHAEFFANLVGTTTIIKKTFVAEDDERSGRSSERDAENYITHPNLYKELRVGQFVFFQRKPCKRVDLIKVTMLPPPEKPKKDPENTTDSVF